MKKILVIENDEAIRANILDLLEAEEFEGIGAQNGRVGVQLARERLPDLILCDIVTPELDRYGVLAELRRDQVTAAIPFIFLTNTSDKSALRQKMNLGEGGYISKPFTCHELLRAIYIQLLLKLC